MRACRLAFRVLMTPKMAFIIFCNLLRAHSGTCSVCKELILFVNIFMCISSDQKLQRQSSMMLTMFKSGRKIYLLGTEISIQQLPHPNGPLKTKVPPSDVEVDDEKLYPPM